MAATEKKSLDDMWKEASDRFKALTDTNLKLSPPKTLEDVRRQIETQQAPDSSTSKETDLKKQAKEASLNALKCLKLLGGVAAQGASMVFGPADLCFNAMSLLLDIPKKIHDFHQIIDSLFDEVSVLLSQFKIYQRIEQFATIDIELYETIHKLMISFVNICALSINLRNAGTWRRFINSTKKVLFDDDSGIKQELLGFRSLIQTQSVIRETVTLEHVLRSEQKLAQLLNAANDSGRRIADIAAGVDVLAAAENNRTLENIKKEQLMKIEKMLLISKEVAQASITTCNDHWNDSVNSSGSWLRDISEYKSWVNIEPDVNPVLLLIGDTNTGKSFLTSAIVHEIQSIYEHGSKDSARTPMLAYHFFLKWTEKNSQDLRSAETALKCLSLQIAKHDTAYAKGIAALSDTKDFKDSSCKELWEALKFVTPKREVTYFLFLDGLDQLSSSNAEQLLNILGTLQHSLIGSERSQIRVLASGKAETFQQELLQSVPSIDIKEHSIPDIKGYIDRELKRHDLLQGRDAEIVKLRNSINDKLPAIVQGNYFKVETALEKINEVVASGGSSEELEQILEEAGQDREIIAQNVVNALNEQLSAKEIEEVNELLVWVIFGADYFDVDALQAALYLRFKTTSLQPLEKKLKGKYAKIFEVGNGFVSIDEDIQDRVKTSESTRSATEDAPQITAAITITKADIKTVQTFLWNLCEKAVINKFEFDESAATTKVKGSIQVNETDAHLAIVKQSFKLLLADPDEKTKALGPYVLEFLPRHLEFLRGVAVLNEIGPVDKREIGNAVYGLLVDGDIIEKYWDYCGSIVRSWFYDEDGITPFWKWLDDPEAIRYLGKKDKESLVQLKSERNPNRSLLRPVTLMVAKRWLQDREWDVGDTYRWIEGFLSMKLVKPVGDDKDGDNDNGGGGDDIVYDNDDNNSFVTPDSDAKTIAKAARWVQKALQIKELNSLWHERLGETYTWFGYYDPAMNAFKEAKSLNNPSWKCFEGMALAYAGKAETSSAISEMQRALEILQRIEGPNDKDRGSIIENLIRLADWKAGLKQPDGAIEDYQEVLNMDPDCYEAHYKILKVLLTAGYVERALDFLDTMSKKNAKDSDLSHLSMILRPLMLDENDDELIFGMICSTTKKSPFFDTVLGHMDRAIELARNEERPHEIAALLLYKGIAIYHYDEREARNPESALGFWEECRCLSSKDEPWTLLRISLRACRLIASHHFQHAISSPDPTSHIEKMKQIAAHRHGFGFIDSHARSTLGCYYARVGDRTKAKQLFLDDMKSAMALLSDDYAENDYQGYYSLADILMHYGDYLNALSAWSLLGPTDDSLETELLNFEDEPERSIARDLITLVRNQSAPEASQPEILQALTKEAQMQASILNPENEADKPRVKAMEKIISKLSANTPVAKGETSPASPKERSGDLCNQCDGRCGMFWRFADDFYCCKFCPDVQLCKSCLARLQNGTLERFICSPNHEWLHVPKWDDKEFAEIRMGKVKINGEFKDGVRVGGEVVTVDEWLNILRDDWGIPRTERGSLESEIKISD